MAAKKSEKKPAAVAAAVDGSSALAKAPARKSRRPAPRAEVLAPAAPVDVPPLAPSASEIRERAYAIHVGGGGSTLENWLRAERELRAERGLPE